MTADYNKATNNVRIITDADARTGKEYRCHECKDWIPEDDCVWVNPDTGAATTGDAGRPFHVSCAPNDTRPNWRPAMQLLGVKQQRDLCQAEIRRLVRDIKRQERRIEKLHADLKAHRLRLKNDHTEHFTGFDAGLRYALVRMEEILELDRETT